MTLAKNKKIICNGPVDETNGAFIFRLPREGNKEDLDIYEGQVLTVGEEITQKEADQLLSASTWNFSEVKE